MYEAFFGFREKPFNLTPDPRFLFLSAKHSEAAAHLEFGLKQRGGFVAITGEVGTGKTTLCRYFLDRLDETTASAFILYPALSAVELLRAVNRDLGIASRGSTPKELVDELHRFLLQARASGRNIVLVIDEAQSLSPEVLEQVRLISNLETATEKLIQIVLIGQPELVSLLAQKSLRQLAQRVTARYHLAPLNREETVHYIRHRLGVAGGAGKVSFTPGALRAIHRFSKGTPRLINLVCDRALLAGFVLNRRQIDRALIQRAIGELGTVPGDGRRRLAWGLRAALGALALAALALALRPQVGVLQPPNDPPKPSSVEPLVAASPSAAPALANTSAADASAANFENRLRTLGAALSRRQAAAVVLGLWKVDVPALEASSASLGESLPTLARRYGLEHTELTTHFDQLRQLNLPVILELFHTSRADTCFAALTRLSADSATLAFSPGDTEEISLENLGRFWVRRAHVLWKDFEGFGRPGADPRRTHVWAQGLLSELGHLPPSSDGEEKLTAGAVARFQGLAFLMADGIVGSKTRMALYSISGRYPVPRVVEP
jgi:general secretion pathway protein A